MATAPAPENRDRTVRTVLLVALVLNLAVAAAKIIFGTAVHALAVRADGFHSLSDALTSVILLVGATLAAAPPDDDHPYGHSKFEVFAALSVGVSLLLVAASLTWDLIERVQGHAEVPHPDATTLVVIGITLVVNVVVAVWQTRAGQRLQSGALLSAATDTRGDIVVTIGVLVSTALVALGYHALDVVAGIVVAGFIGFTAFSILKENLNYLADRALVHADQVLAIATAVPGVLSASDVRTRGAPGAIFVDLHIQVAGETTVAVAHDVSHLMADHIRSEIAGIADVHVHIEPA